MIKSGSAKSGGQGRDAMFSVWLNNFQYQDKLALIAALRDEEMHVPFVVAVGQFVDDFEQTYSVDAPYPKRIGRWIGLHAPMPVINRLIQWANSIGPHQTSSRYREEFRNALEVAKDIDRASRPPLMDAA